MNLPYAATLPFVKSVVTTQVRGVSSKYTRPHPRSYKRRLYEAAVKPVLPETSKPCGLQIDQSRNRHRNQTDDYTPYENALAEKVSKWIAEEQFRVKAVCQALPVPGRTLTFARNQLRLKGLEMRTDGNKIMKKVFEGTPLQTLEMLYDGNNFFLFGRDEECLKAIVSETAKLYFIVPLGMTYNFVEITSYSVLAVTVDDRILSMKHVEELAKFSSFDQLWAQTVQILSQTSTELTQCLDRPARDLTGAVSHLSQQH
jgi:ribosomal protein L10